LRTASEAHSEILTAIFVKPPLLESSLQVKRKERETNKHD